MYNFIALYQKLKQITWIIIGLLIFLLMLTPYWLTFYVEYRYNKLIKLIEKFTPSVKIKTYVRRGYVKSSLISKIQVAKDFLIYDPNVNSENALINYVPQKTFTVQSEISFLPFNYNFLTISTKFLTGLPAFIKNQQDLKILSYFNYKGNLTIKAENLKINYAIPQEFSGVLNLEEIKIHLTDHQNNLHANVELPKVIYTEDLNKIEIENLNFNFKLREYNNYEKIRIKLLTTIDRLYLVNQSKLILKLANLNVEQKLSDKLSNSISFLNLNILHHKFGPLTTKWQINNVGLVKLFGNFKDFKLPINKSKINNYSALNFINGCMRYKPSISTDLLLYIGKDKMEVLSDYIFDPQNTDWLELGDILDSLSINLFAKIPKEIAIDLLYNFLEFQQNRKYNNVKYVKNMNSNLAAKLDTQELHNLAVEKIKYLLKHNIIQAEDNIFVLNLSISEGTFFSRMNPFKVFSF